MTIQIGRIGIFELDELVDGPIPTTPLVVVAVNTIANLTSVGIDVYVEAYERFGVSKLEYSKIDSGDTVVTFKTEQDVRISIPEKFIISVDDFRRVTYTTKALIISLGSHPIAKTFDLLSKEFEAIVEEYVGHKSTAEVIDISKGTTLNVAEHSSLTLQRDAAREKYISPFTKLTNRESELAVAELKIKALEDFIENYLVTCGTGCVDPEDPGDPTPDPTGPLTPSIVTTFTGKFFTQTINVSGDSYKCCFT